MSRLLENLSARAILLLLTVFTTLWAIVFYCAYWRNYFFLGWLAAAVGIDILRYFSGATSELYKAVYANRYLIVCAVLAAYATHTWLTLSYGLSNIAFGAAYLHYEQAKQVAGPWRAVIVYVSESAAVTAAFVLLLYYSIRQSSSAADQEADRDLETLRVSPGRWWATISVVGIFIMLACVMLTSLDLGFIRGSKTGYDPGTNAFELFVYFIAPIIFAAVSKHWLARAQAAVKLRGIRGGGANECYNWDKSWVANGGGLDFGRKDDRIGRKIFCTLLSKCGRSPTALTVTALVFFFFQIGAFAAAGDSKRIEARILSDIEEMSKSGRLGNYITEFDFICFSVHNTLVRQELMQQAQRLGRKFSISLNSCGVENSCCRLRSQASGIVSLVKNDEVRCVEIYEFDYWTDESQPICTPARNLIVERVTGPVPISPGRPAFRASRPSYKIKEHADPAIHRRRG